MWIDTIQFLPWRWIFLRVVKVSGSTSLYATLGTILESSVSARSALIRALDHSVSVAEMISVRRKLGYMLKDIYTSIHVTNYKASIWLFFFSYSSK